VHNIQFTFNGTEKTGIGFTFGQTNPEDYVSGDEYYGNVAFYGCWFNRLYKGVQFPFGNIGSEFYSCGWTNNYYGVYTINAKFGGTMHAGNKYFYSGHITGNVCGIYIDGGEEPLSGIVFNGTIIEENNIGLYIFTTSMYSPVTLNDIHFEGNSVLSNATIDKWTGSTVSTQTLDTYSLIVDGSGLYNIQGGFVTGIHIISSYIEIFIKNSRVENSSGYGRGQVSIIDYPISSTVHLINCITVGGMPKTRGFITEGAFTPHSSSIGSNTNVAIGRGALVGPRFTKSTSLKSVVYSIPCTSICTTTGTYGSVPCTVVSDGCIYSTCNELTLSDFASGQYAYISNPQTAITSVIGWYVFSIDIKIITGGISVKLWDRGSTNFVIFNNLTITDGWSTLAGIGYSSGAQSFFVDFAGLGLTSTWRFSAVQLHVFDRLSDAQNFLASGVFSI
jgi:hypothetical protein